MNQTSRALAIGLTWATLTATVPAQQPLHPFCGNAANDEFGRSVSGAGDVNGDGYDDVIVGAYLDDRGATNAGSARVLSGLDGSVLWDLNGNSQGDRFGFAVSGAGDVDGDGHADFIVGAFRDDPNGSDSGSATVYSGADRSPLKYLVGAAAGDRFGIAVAAAGDVDGDGFADVIVGASHADTAGPDSGTAIVYSVRRNTTLLTRHGATPGARFGAAVAGAGDVDGDGYDDVIVGAPLDDHTGADSGSANVYSVHTGTRIRVLGGRAAGDRFGGSVSTAGDVDADGRADLAVGAWGTDHNGTDSGSVYLFLGINGREHWRFDGASATDQLGIVSSVGDMDDDGFDDVVVGAWRNDRNGTDAGTAYVLSGVSGRQRYRIDGHNAGDHFGLSVSGAGDADGDGFPDIIVGAYRADANGNTNAGCAYIYRLAPRDGYLRTRYNTWGRANSYGGYSMSRIADLDNDGYDDLIVAAPYDDVAASNAGAAHIVSMRRGIVIRTFRGSTSQDLFGFAVSGVGDVDQDGHGDFAIGAPGELLGRGSVYLYSGRTWAVMQRYVGATVSDRLGASLAPAGDVNGDGIADFLIGAPGNSSGRGIARVISGATRSTLRSHSGVSAGDRFGHAVSGAGDFNGDGFDDYAIGAPQRDLLATGPGYVQVFSGRSGTIILNGALPGPFRGRAHGDAFGSALCAAGDTNGDGLPELAIGAYREDQGTRVDAGAVHIMSHAFPWTVQSHYGNSTGARLGFSLAGIGDANGDGRDDLVTGAIGVDDAMLLQRGTMTRFRGTAGTEFGFSVTGCGDMNGDGYADFVVGMPGDDRVGVDSGAWVQYWSEMETGRGRFWTYGPARVSSQGKLPRIGHSRRLRISDSFSVDVRRAPPFSLAIMALGLDQQAIDLSAFGLNGCVGLTTPAVTFFYVTDAEGFAGHPDRIANLNALIGLNIYFQWYLWDPPSNPVGLITSNAVRGTIGDH